MPNWGHIPMKSVRKSQPSYRIDVFKALIGPPLYRDASILSVIFPYIHHHANLCLRVDRSVTILINHSRQDCENSHAEKLASLGIMGAPLNTTVLWWSPGGFLGLSSAMYKWLPWDASLSDSYRSDSYIFCTFDRAVFFSV